MASLSCALDDAAFRVANRAGLGEFVSSANRLAHVPIWHMSIGFLDSSSASQGRGPSTVLLLNVLAHRWFSQRSESIREHGFRYSSRRPHLSTKSNRSAAYLSKNFLCAAFQSRMEKPNAATLLPRRVSSSSVEANQPR
jgi:hypothetical protein